MNDSLHYVLIIAEHIFLKGNWKFYSNFVSKVWLIISIYFDKIFKNDRTQFLCDIELNHAIME